MAMPVLLLLFALILSVGLFFLGQVKATVSARSDAFQSRTSQKSRRPLSYNQQTSRADVYSRTATSTPQYPSPRINFGPVSVNDATLGGSWDHREILRQDGPHWNDMAKVTSGGATNQIGSILDEFSNGFDPSTIPGLGEVAGGLVGALQNKSDSLSGQFEKEDQKQQEKKQENISDLKERNEKLKNERSMLRGEIDNMHKPRQRELNQQIEMRKKAIDKEDDPDKKKELEKAQKQDQDELKQVNQQIKEKEARIKQIDQQIKVNEGLSDRLQDL